jgi:hypothetical protein
MKSPHAASAIILIFFVFLAIGCADTEESIETDISSGSPVGSSTGDTSPPTRAQPTDSAVHVTARKLFRDYDANEVNADEKYKGKTLVVSGRIGKIGKDLLDTMYVELKSANPIFGVQCMFADKHKSQLAKAAKGRQVTIRGKCDGKLGNVLLRGCSFDDEGSATDLPPDIGEGFGPDGSTVTPNSDLDSVEGPAKDE